MIAIVGAGPVGLYLAYLLSSKRNDICVYEDHKVIGEPVQCSGILTPEINKILKIPEDIIVNKYTKVKIHSKHKTTEANNNDILIDRKKFDQWLGEKAKKAGARIYLSHRYIGRKGKELEFETEKGKKTVIVDKIIFANGPSKKNESIIAIQAVVKGKFDPKSYEVYLGSISPKFFAYILPENEKTARAALAGKKQELERFLQKKNIEKIIEWQGGRIPIYKKRKCYEKGAYYIGDAAGQVKATTGGGIVPGLKAAKILADCIINKKNYDKEIKKINKELKMHLKIRKTLNKFKDKDYDELLRLIDQKKIKKILETINRDNSSKLVTKMIFAEPRLLKYTTKIL